jgi:hypothetical protein
MLVVGILRRNPAIRNNERGGNMSWESRRLAGILLVILPTVIFDGVSLLSLLISDPRYTEMVKFY